MSYIELPADTPVPRVCTQCGLVMRQRVAEMLPLDPQTGEGATWLVTECPHHYSTGRGNWGTKHHLYRWKAWYHDAWMVKPVPAGYTLPKEPKEPMSMGQKLALSALAALMLIGGISSCIAGLT